MADDNGGATGSTVPRRQLGRTLRDLRGNARLTVTNCTLTGNRGPNGGGIYNAGNNLGVATLTIGNTILNVAPCRLRREYLQCQQLRHDYLAGVQFEQR